MLSDIITLLILGHIILGNKSKLVSHKDCKTCGNCCKVFRFYATPNENLFKALNNKNQQSDKTIEQITNQITDNNGRHERLQIINKEPTSHNIKYESIHEGKLKISIEIPCSHLIKDSKNHYLCNIWNSKTRPSQCEEFPTSFFQNPTTKELLSDAEINNRLSLSKNKQFCLPLIKMDVTAVKNII